MESFDGFIKKYLRIDAELPAGLRWIGHSNSQMNGKLKGKPVGGVGKNGYYHSKIMGREIYNHRVIFFLHNGMWPYGEVDHIDGCKTNNHPANLRDVTTSENAHNTIAKGYCWDKSRNKWMAKIRLNRKYINLGRFNTEQEARAAYLKAKSELHITAPDRCFDSR